MIQEPLKKIVFHVELFLGKSKGKKIIRRFGRRDTHVFLPEIGYTEDVVAGPFKTECKVTKVSGENACGPAGPYDVYLTPIRSEPAKSTLEHFLNDTVGKCSGYGWIEKIEEK